MCTFGTGSACQFNPVYGSQNIYGTGMLQAGSALGLANQQFQGGLAQAGGLQQVYGNLGAFGSPSVIESKLKKHAYYGKLRDPITKKECRVLGSEGGYTFYTNDGTSSSTEIENIVLEGRLFEDESQVGIPAEFISFDDEKVLLNVIWISCPPYPNDPGVHQRLTGYVIDNLRYLELLDKANDK
jgi:hypothetical protein